MKNSIILSGKFQELASSFDKSLLVEGDVFELGVYKGGSTAFLKKRLIKRGSNRTIFAFDTFEGMPFEQGDWSKDLKKEFGSPRFTDTCLALVKNFVLMEATTLDGIQFVEGKIPSTFFGFENVKLSFVLLDLDLYFGYKSALDFVWPRISVGGAIFMDDYNEGSCPGATMAVKEFLEGREDYEFDGKWTIRKK